MSDGLFLTGNVDDSFPKIHIHKLNKGETWKTKGKKKPYSSE